MDNRDEVLRSFFRKKDSLRVENPEDIELAFLLQNAPTIDSQLLERMVYRHTIELLNWVGILLYYRNMEFPSQEEIRSIVIEVFQTALYNAQQFHGQESVSVWLFSLSYQIVNQMRVRDWKQFLSRRGNRLDNNSCLADQTSGEYLTRLDQLPKKLCLPIILRYFFRFELPAIADILDIQTLEVHKRLIKSRMRLLVNPIALHLDKQIQAYVDGLLTDDPDGNDQLRQHLAACDLCQSSVIEINKSEETLAESIKERWDSRFFVVEDLNLLIESILAETKRPEQWWNISLRLKQVEWIIGLVVMFVGLAFIFVKLTPVEREFSQSSKTPTQQLPPIVDNESLETQLFYKAVTQSDPRFIDPAFSRDGKWAVFALINYDFAGWSATLPTIEVYDRDANTIEVISRNSILIKVPWTWWNMAPSISGDGRWIVYVSATDYSDISGEPCKNSEGTACLDIFLYNRETGKARRLTQSVTSGGANGDSLAPTISEDGRWVAFWSSASNLIDGFTSTCQRGETSLECLYIYLYNVDTGVIERIPIPAIPGNPVSGVDRISLSADGRYVGFTISPTAITGFQLYTTPRVIGLQGSASSGDNHDSSIPKIAQSSEVIIYDRETGKYELENQALDGTPGDGESYSPVLSGDGRYVAFVSASTNLVEGDTNNNSDVFVRDRQSMKVELVSVSSTGEIANGESGSSFWDKGYYSLIISGDGRYIVFESRASNLSQVLSSECNNVDRGACEKLYIHDRQTGSTELITAVPGQEFMLFPDISSGGRWISFMQTFTNCSAPQILCSNVILFDRQRGWSTNLTKFGAETPRQPWVYSGSIALPWEARQSTGLAFSPDGKLVAVGGIDSTVRLWKTSDLGKDVRNDTPDATLETYGNEQFSTLAFTPGGEWLAAGASSGSVYIWRISDGKLIYSLKDQTGQIQKVVFTQDGSRLIISTLNEIWMWSIDSNQLSRINNFSFGSTAAYAIDISLRGNMVASAKGDGTVWLQILPVGNVVERLGAGSIAVSNIAFSQDGSLLATHSTDGAIRLWQISGDESITPSLKLINVFQSYGYGGEFAFSPDNKYLVSTGGVGEIFLWNLTDGKISSISSPQQTGMISSLAFTDQGDKLAEVSGGQISVWEKPITSSSSFFVNATADNDVDSAASPASTANDIPHLRWFDSNFVIGYLNLEQAALLSTFPLIIPTHLPDDLSFSQATIIQDDSVLLKFDTNSQQASLYIFERSIGSEKTPPMLVGASANIMQKQVTNLSGQATAEYVRGDWIWAQNISAPTDESLHGEMHGQWAWTNASDSQRLHWQQDGVLIALYYRVNQPFTPVLSGSSQSGKLIYLSPNFGEGDLTQIAAGMVPYGETNKATKPFLLYPVNTDILNNGWIVNGNDYTITSEVRQYFTSGEQLLR